MSDIPPPSAEHPSQSAINAGIEDSQPSNPPLTLVNDDSEPITETEGLFEISGSEIIIMIEEEPVVLPNSEDNAASNNSEYIELVEVETTAPLEISEPPIIIIEEHILDSTSARNSVDIVSEHNELPETPSENMHEIPELENPSLLIMPGDSFFEIIEKESQGILYPINYEELDTDTIPIQNFTVTENNEDQLKNVDQPNSNVPETYVSTLQVEVNEVPETYVSTLQVEVNEVPETYVSTLQVELNEIPETYVSTLQVEANEIPETYVSTLQVEVKEIPTYLVEEEIEKRAIPGPTESSTSIFESQHIHNAKSYRNLPISRTKSHQIIGTSLDNSDSENSELGPFSGSLLRFMSSTAMIDFIVEMDNTCDRHECDGSTNEAIDACFDNLEDEEFASDIDDIVENALLGVASVMTHLASVDDLGPYKTFDKLTSYFTLRPSKSEGSHLTVKDIEGHTKSTNKSFTGSTSEASDSDVVNVARSKSVPFIRSNEFFSGFGFSDMGEDYAREESMHLPLHWSATIIPGNFRGVTGVQDNEDDERDEPVAAGFKIISPSQPPSQHEIVKSEASIPNTRGNLDASGAVKLLMNSALDLSNQLLGPSSPVNNTILSKARTLVSVANAMINLNATGEVQPLVTAALDLSNYILGMGTSTSKSVLASVSTVVSIANSLNNLKAPGAIQSLAFSTLDLTNQFLDHSKNKDKGRLVKDGGVGNPAATSRSTTDPSDDILYKGNTRGNKAGSLFPDNLYAPASKTISQQSMQQEMTTPQSESNLNNGDDEDYKSNIRGNKGGSTIPDNLYGSVSTEQSRLINRRQSRNSILVAKSSTPRDDDAALKYKTQAEQQPGSEIPDESSVQEHFMNNPHRLTSRNSVVTFKEDYTNSRPSEQSTSGTTVPSVHTFGPELARSKGIISHHNDIEQRATLIINPDQLYTPTGSTQPSRLHSRNSISVAPEHLNSHSSVKRKSVVINFGPGNTNSTRFSKHRPSTSHQSIDTPPSGSQSKGYIKSGEHERPNTAVPTENHHILTENSPSYSELSKHGSGMNTSTASKNTLGIAPSRRKSIAADVTPNDSQTQKTLIVNTSRQSVTIRKNESRSTSEKLLDLPSSEIESSPPNQSDSVEDEVTSNPTLNTTDGASSSTIHLANQQPPNDDPPTGGESQNPTVLSVITPFREFEVMPAADNLKQSLGGIINIQSKDKSEVGNVTEILPSCFHATVLPNILEARGRRAFVDMTFYSEQVQRNIIDGAVDKEPNSGKFPADFVLPTSTVSTPMLTPEISEHDGFGFLSSVPYQYVYSDNSSQGNPLPVKPIVLNDSNEQLSSNSIEMHLKETTSTVDQQQFSVTNSDDMNGIEILPVLNKPEFTTIEAEFGTTPLQIKLQENFAMPTFKVKVSPNVNFSNTTKKDTHGQYSLLTPNDINGQRIHNTEPESQSSIVPEVVKPFVIQAAEIELLKGMEDWKQQDSSLDDDVIASELPVVKIHSKICQEPSETNRSDLNSQEQNLAIQPTDNFSTMSSEHDLSAQNSSGYIYFAPAYESDIHALSQTETMNHSDGESRNKIPKPAPNKNVTKLLDDSLSGKRNYDSFGTIIDDSPISISSGYNISWEKHGAESDPEKLFESMNISEPRPITPELDTEFQQRPVSSELERQNIPAKQIENTSEKKTYKILGKKKSRSGNNKINESTPNQDNDSRDFKGAKSSNVTSSESNCDANYLNQNNSKVKFNALGQVENISPIASPAVSISAVVQNRGAQLFAVVNGLKTLTSNDLTETPATLVSNGYHPASNVHNSEFNVSTTESNVATLAYDELTPTSSTSNDSTLALKYSSPGPKPESIKIDSNPIDEIILTCSDEDIPLKKLSKCPTTSSKTINDEEVKFSSTQTEISNNDGNEPQLELQVDEEKISLSKPESSDIVKKQVSKIRKDEKTISNVVRNSNKLTNRPSNTKKFITTSVSRTSNVTVSKQGSAKPIQPQDSQFAPSTSKGSSNNSAKSSAVPSRVGLVSKNQKATPSSSNINKATTSNKKKSDDKKKPDDKGKPKWK